MCSWHLNWNRRNIFLDSRIIYHCYDTTLVKSTVSAVCLRIKKLSYCLNKIYIYEMTIHICLTEEFRELISCASVRSWKKAKERENDCLKVVRHGVICFCRADYLYERFWHGTLKKHLVIIREAVRKTLTLSLSPSPPASPNSPSSHFALIASKNLLKSYCVSGTLPRDILTGLRVNSPRLHSLRGRTEQSL